MWWNGLVSVLAHSFTVDTMPLDVFASKTTNRIAKPIIATTTPAATLTNRAKAKSTIASPSFRACGSLDRDPSFCRWVTALSPGRLSLTLMATRQRAAESSDVHGSRAKGCLAARAMTSEKDQHDCPREARAGRER